MTYKKLTQEEIESVFNKMTEYGLELIGDVVEAWQFNHEEDGTILKDAYTNICSIKECEAVEYKTSLTRIVGLTRSLKSMDHKQFSFIEDLLELDPYDVFGSNPYVIDEDEDYQKENVGVNPYREICEYVNRERERRLSEFVDTAELFSRRFYRSMSKKNDLINNNVNELYSDRFNRSNSAKSTYTFGDLSSYSEQDSSELFSKRFNKSISKKLTYKPGDLRPYSE